MDAPLHRHTCEVAFGDTDASGWMHFPNIFRYFEEAEHAFLKSRGILVFDRAQGGWPRVKVTCDYKRPLITGDRIEVLLEIARLGASSVTWNFEVLDPSGETAAFGSVTTVRVDHEGRPQIISEGERKALEKTV
jgi:YbgC/YbaW family acyl-CoA thioester hydrolase